MTIRIIGGSLKGRGLIAPKGKGTNGPITRPITAALRKSLFDSCQFFIGDSVVLDLFAGSGSIGIEAISRGASYSYLIDLSKDAISTIRMNLEKLEITDQVSVIHKDAFSIFPNTFMKPIDIAFLHPPYPLGQTGYEKLIGYIEASLDHFTPNAHFYLETPSKLTELCEELLMKSFHIIKVKQSSTTGLIHFSKGD